MRVCIFRQEKRIIIKVNMIELWKCLICGENGEADAIYYKGVVYAKKVTINLL